MVWICNTGQAKVTDLGENKTGQLLRVRSPAAEPHRRWWDASCDATASDSKRHRSRAAEPRGNDTRPPTCSSRQRDGSHLESERNRLQSLAQNTFSTVCSLYLSAYPQQSCLDHLINSSAQSKVTQTSPQRALERSLLGPTSPAWPLSTHVTSSSVLPTSFPSCSQTHSQSCTRRSTH